MKTVILSILVLSFHLIPIFSTGQRTLQDNQNIFNEALNAYRQNDFAKTAELLNSFTDVLPENIDEQKMMLSANNSFKLSSKSFENNKDIETSISHIDNSIAFYERILEKNRANAIAGHNMELALKAREELIKKQETQQNKQQENKERQNQLDDLQKQQEDLASDTQKGADDHKSKQNDLMQKTNELSEEMSSENEEFQNNMEIAENKQQEAIEEIDKQNYENAEELQNEAAQHLKKASESISGEQKEEQTIENEQASENDKQSDDIAQSLIENENNRESTEEISDGGFQVDRNW